MQSGIKVSIITVTYNCAKTLQRTIDSVLRQSYPNIEYLLIDGGSSDGTLDIIKENAAKHPNMIHFISEKDNGLYDAMNKGISMATGEIIGIINGDDYYRENAVNNAVHLLSDDFDIVYSDLIYSRNGKEDTKNILRADHKNLKKRMSVNHPTCFVKANVYKIYGCFDTTFRIAADYELMARFYSNHCRFIKSDDVLAVMEAGGLSNNNKKAINEKYRVHKKYFSGVSAEFYRIKNYMLYSYRKIKNKRDKKK